MYALFLIAISCMIQKTEHFVAHEDLNLIQDEQYRHFCRESSFQRGDFYKTVKFNKAARNEFVVLQVAKVNTDCNFQLTAMSNSREELTVRNIFPTDHLNQNVILLVACSKLLRQKNYFRVWYHAGGILRSKPYDESEGLKYVQIAPEPKCSIGKETGKNQSIAFVHFTMSRIRLPVTNNTEAIWERIGDATDIQQPRFRSYESLTKYQKSVFVPDSFIGKQSPIIELSHSIILFTVISFINAFSFLF
uniref:ZP domain-containing protein n=2 Tax=Wuchereria bancrofti TaxID=6293 RepID=A0AAF5PRU7_WUCBA